MQKLSPAQRLNAQRGKPPKGKRWTSSSVYYPRDTRIKNPKVAAHVQMMHEKWLATFNERQARKATTQTA